MSKNNDMASMESAAIGLGILGLMAYGAYQHLYFLWAFIWRILKLCQMFVLFTIEMSVEFISSPFTSDLGWGFKEGLFEVLGTHYTQITPEYMAIFDGHYGELLRWPFAMFLLYLGFSEYKLRAESHKQYDVESLIRSASKVHPHLRRLVPANNIDKLLGYTIGLVVPSFRERLKGENPINFSHDYDFNNRTSEANRYAMGISPYEMLTANPPMGITQAEYDDDNAMMAETGFTSNFRPICHFFIEANANDSSIDFCFHTAGISLERQLLMPLKPKISDMKLVGRLFDKEGQLVPLEFENKHGVATQKLTNQGSIVSGFRPTTLLNDGLEYKGPIEDAILLFNTHEKQVLLQLKQKMDGKVSRSFEEILYLVITKKHAYSTTVIWSLMSLFKNVNRIAGTEFTWLKRKNRELSMIMQSIGRETPFLEANATRAHFLMETKAEMRLTIPSVQTAINDLHVNAVRILNAGKKKEDLLNMTESEFSKIFELNDSKLTKKENEATEILKSMGVDVGKKELWKDPYDDVPELIKQYEMSENKQKGS